MMKAIVSVIFSALTLDDERRVISNLISGFVRQISFGRDFEQRLSFYVESRSSFTNLDIVLVQLIQVRNEGIKLIYLSPVCYIIIKI